jgi:hypothetical protein
VNDRASLEAQIGRPLRAHSEVVVRCRLDLPVVATVPPVLDDGTPFPTRYWLSCPLASTRIGRLEAMGGVRRMEARASNDVEFGARLIQAHERYARERDALVPGDALHRPSGGVAGSSAGVKCLHAHYADHAAGNDNPVGEAAAMWVEPLDCTTPCVVDGVPNPDWTEPR